MLIKYFLILGIIIFLVGLTEIILPKKMISIWNRWINSKFFYLHGLVLIIFGIPLTIKQPGILGTLIFIIGIFIIISGPLILLYSDKFKESFYEMINEFSTSDITRLVRVDGTTRIAFGLILLLKFFISNY